MSTRIVDIGLDPSFDTIAYQDVEQDLSARIRRATSVVYEERKWLGGQPPDDMVYALDRSVNWACYPDLLTHTLAQFRSSRRTRRNRNSSQWLMYSSNYEHVVEHIYGPPGTTQKTPADILSEVCRDELESMMCDRSVLFHHRRSAFFRMPSGEISDYFLRVGNIQKDRKNLEVIAFWSLPYLKGIDHVVSDSWSISSTAAYICQFIGQYEPGSRALWSYLGAYLPEDSRDVQHLEALARSRSADNGDVLFLVSASSSGRLHQEFDTVLEGEPNAGRFRKLTLYSLNDARVTGDVLHSLEEFLLENELRGVTSSGSIGDAPVVEIDKSTYIPDYRLTRTVDFDLVEHTRNAKAFFHRYSGNGIFSVSKRGRTSRMFSGRHHSYHVDVSSLMKHPHFRQALSSRIDDIGHVDGIVLTPGDANNEFLNAIQEAHKEKFGQRIGNEFQFASFSKLAESDQLVGLLNDRTKHVAFIDALFITGGNLKALSSTIRKMRDEGDASKSLVTYLVGLYRPYSFSKVKWSKTTFPKASNHTSFRGRMLAVEEVLLPHWTEAECPWQRELRSHIASVDQMELSSQERTYILERILTLQCCIDGGLRGEDVFFKRFPQDEFPFWSGSFFLDTNKVIEKNREVGIDLSRNDIDQADLVCAVASAMQTWRSGADTNRLFVNEISFERAINQQITSDNNAFNEPMLRAAIWRALNPKEISTQPSDSDTQSMLIEIYFADPDVNSQRVLAAR